MAIAGKEGSITVTGATPCASIKTWKLDTETDVLDTTALGDDWKNFIMGLNGWTASAEGDWLVTTDTGGQISLHDAFFASTLLTLKLYVDATHYYTGTAYLTKMPVETPVGETVTISFEFQGTGAVTYN